MSDKLVYLARTAKFGEVRATRKLAMIALCNGCLDTGDGVDASTDTIKETAECSDRTAYTIRKEFEEIGLLELQHRGGNGRFDRTIYRINVELLKGLSEGTVVYGLLLADARTRQKPATVAGLPEEGGEDKPATKPAAKGETKPATYPATKPATASDDTPPAPPFPLHPLSPPIIPPTHTTTVSPEAEKARVCVSEDADARVDQSVRRTGSAPPTDPLNALRADGIAPHVVETFIAPLWGVLGTIPVLAKLIAIRDELAGFSEPVLAEAARHVRANWSVWRSPAKCREACTDAARKVPNGVRVLPGTPAWNAWMGHWRNEHNRWALDYWPRQGYAFVPTEYPPKSRVAA